MRSRFSILIWLAAGIFLLSILSIFLQPCQNHFWNCGNVYHFERTFFGQITYPQSNNEENHEFSQKENNKKNMLAQFAIFLGGSIITAVIGVFFGVITANRNRRNDAISVFNVFIALKKSELDSIDAATDWKVFYTDGKQEFREAIFRIAPHLSKTQRRAFAEIWKEYKSGETHQKLEHAPSGGSDMLAYELEEDVRGKKSPLSKEQILHDFLNQMDAIASERQKIFGLL